MLNYSTSFLLSYTIFLPIQSFESDSDNNLLPLTSVTISAAVVLQGHQRRKRALRHHFGINDLFVCCWYKIIQPDIALEWH